jgi:hypothetical protein
MQNELTAERIELAIKEIADVGMYGSQVHQETMETALATLRAEQERNNGCEWCNTELRFECYLIDDDGHTASIENNVVQTIIADYCPVCGRLLTEGSAE